MAISKDELKEMNNLISKGKTISDLAKRYPQYGYWEIYWKVNDYSFLGKKRSITNRLKRLADNNSKEDRAKIVSEAQELLDELYNQLKKNSAKLVDIDHILLEENK